MPLRLWRRLFFHLRDSLRACSRLLRASLQLDLDLDAGGELQGHQGLHGLGGGLEDVDEALMGAALELLAGMGRGMGPDTDAPVRLAVSTIFSALWSMSW